MVPCCHSVGGFNAPEPSFRMCVQTYNLQHHYEEDMAVRRTQQAQLDALQVQLRDLVQQQSDMSEQLTSLSHTLVSPSWRSA